MRVAATPALSGRSGPGADGILASTTASAGSAPAIESTATESSETPTTDGGSTYRPALDGLRALAVMAVFLYHADVAWASGGFLGVDVFFVLSGFLITGLLLADRERHGRVRLKRFWARRARRLLPALFLVLVAVAVAVPLLAPDQNFRLPRDLGSALGYVSNWNLIFEDLSYFEAIGRPPLLQHLWSLAVEEQFYLLWPLVLLVALKLSSRRRGLAVVVLALAAGSTVLMASMYDPAADPSRVYYGTDTRVAALLVGSALAFLWPRGRSGPRRGARPALEIAGLVAVLAVGWFVVTLDQFEPRLYQGGFFVVAVLSAAAVATCAAERVTLVGRVLSWRPLVWLGKRSYGVYLWFWPVFMLTRPNADVSLSGWRLILLQAAITVVLAAASYRFVEMPIRSGALGRQWAVRRRLFARGKRVRTIAVSLAVVAAFTALAAGIVVDRETPEPSWLASSSAEDLTSVAEPSMTTSATPVTTAPPVVEPDPAAAPAQAPTPPPDVPPPAPVAVAVLPPLPSIATPVTAIGDSVLIAVKPVLQAQIPTLVFDAVVARQASVTLAQTRALKDSGQVHQDVILQLGNNGVVTAGQLDQFMALFSGARRVVVVNVLVPRPWEAPNNEVLAAGVARAPNAVLADWHNVGSAHPDAFRDDGVHLTPTGVHLLSHLILASLQ